MKLVKSRGFERKGKDNNPYKMMLRNINKKATSTTYIKNWVNSRIDSVIHDKSKNVFVVSYKGKTFEAVTWAEVMYKLIVTYGAK